MVERFAERSRMHGRQVAVDQPGIVELAEDGHDAAGAVDVFHVHVRLGRRDLAQHRHLARQRVDVVLIEVDLALMGGGQDVQHGVGRAAHGDVERHGVLEGALRGDAARQCGVVVLFVIALGEIDDQMAGLDEQPLAVGMRRQRRAVAGQRQAERLGQAIHRIGGEHARAGAAGRAGRALDDLDVLVGNLVVGGRNHGVDQIERLRLAGEHHLAGFHRPAGDEDGRDVEAQRRHQHAGRDLVAIGDADHGVGAVGVDHVFDRVGDQFARRQRIEHAVMAHGDAVIDGDGVEFLGDAAGLFDLARDQLAKVLEMDMARHELGEGIDHGDDRLAEIANPSCRWRARGRGRRPCCGHGWWCGSDRRA